jgi:hypothetical protein
MPAVSKSQQRLMGMVHAYKQGDLEIKDLPAGLVKKIKGIAEGQKKKTGDKRKKTSGMSDKDAKDFASTKHKGLPEKVKENVITKFDDFLNESFKKRTKRWYNDREEWEKNVAKLDVADDSKDWAKDEDGLYIAAWDSDKGMGYTKTLKESLGDPYDFFDKYEITAGGASGAIEYGFIDVHIDEIDDEIQFEIEQDMNGNQKVVLRDNLDGDKLEKVIDILREYGVDIDAKTLRIEDEDSIGAIMREYAQLS